MADTVTEMRKVKHAYDRGITAIKGGHGVRPAHAHTRQLVVNVALPTMQRELGAGVSGLQWIIDAYTLTFASFMLTGGALGDLYGRKRFFMAGLVVLTAGSLLCALFA